jgi:hypothetical protein
MIKINHARSELKPVQGYIHTSAVATARFFMVRVKITNRQGSPASILKKVKKAAARVKQLASRPGGLGEKAGSHGTVHTGKLKFPFKPASSGKKILIKAKNGLIKQLKRR